MDRKTLKEILPLKPEVPEESELAEIIPVDNDDQEAFVSSKGGEDAVVYAPLEWGADLLSPNPENEMFPGFENDFPVLVNSLLDSLGTLSFSEDSNTYTVGESNHPNSAATSEENDSQSGYYNLWKDNPWTNCCANFLHELLPKISCFSTLSSQTIGRVFFYVDGGVANWTPSIPMEITIIDPNNCRLTSQLTRESVPFSSRLICTFTAILPGWYSVTVKRGMPISLDICGSPFSIPVSRNYKLKASLRLIGQAERAWGIAYSSISKKIYVTDGGLSRVHIYHEDGIFEKSIGTKGRQPEQFYLPTAIAVDNLNQRLVICDKANHRICIYTLDGTFLFTFGGRGFKKGQMKYPWGVGVSGKNSDIAVADSGNHRLLLFDSNGNFLRMFSVFETYSIKYKLEFNQPRGVCFDANGDNIYVTDYRIQAVFKFDNKLTKKTRITPPELTLNGPQGLAIDPVGNLLICDSLNNRIQVVSPEGSPITSILGNCADSFWNPTAVSVTPTGGILVLDAKSRFGIM